jgi:hypothetical protein
MQWMGLMMMMTTMMCYDNKEHGNVRRACDKDEGIDCEDGDSDTDW